MSEVIVIRIDEFHKYFKRNTKLLLTNSKKVIKTEFLNFFNYLINILNRFRTISRDDFTSFLMETKHELQNYLITFKNTFIFKVAWNTLSNFITNLSKNEKLLNILFDILKSLSINCLFALKDIFSFENLFFYATDKIIENTDIFGDYTEYVKNIIDISYLFFILYINFR